MSQVGAILLRFAAILAGYLAAALLASAFLHLIVLGPLSWTGEEAAWVATGSAITSVPFVALFVAYFAFIPAAVAIVAGELLSRRDWLWWAICGGVSAALVAAVILAGPDGTDEAVADPGFLAVVVAAGLVGGFGYWLVAGRGAGGWRPTAPGRSGS